jgi:hypothetical protein
MKDVIFVAAISVSFAVAYLALIQHPSSGNRSIVHDSGYEISGSDPAKTYDI